MKKTLVVASIALFIGGFATVALASHAWGKYHWNKSTEDTTSKPLELGDNVSAIWDSSLATASADWNVTVLKNQVVAGSSNANCDPVSGTVQVCNGEYGNNGWLGIASIWATRGKSNHITQALVKVNDTYFNTSTYNTQSWRDYVICQEVGHTLGLDHQDENFYNANLGTCMDYTSDPDGTVNGQLDNRHPNVHDDDMMTEIYAHLNSTTTDSGSGPGNGNGNGNGKKPKKLGTDIDLNDPSAWGRAIKQDAEGRNSLYERDLGNGQVLITHVIWAE